MRKAFSGRRLCAAAALTAATLVGGGLAMAPAASAGTATPAPAGAPGSQVTPDGNSAGCMTVLRGFDELTTTTQAICATTTVNAVFNPSHAYTACVVAMSHVGVNTRVAMTACSFAAFG